MILKLDVIKNVLLKVTDKVYHYEAFEQSDQYIVWAEDSEASSVEADNKKQQQTIQGTIDYFTKIEGDTTVEAIQEALNNACISFYLNSVQYEDETKFIHYEWVFEVV